MTANYYIGTAAWSIPKEARLEFPGEGSVLEKYSQKFNAVEINSSFYRPHKAKTYERWAQCVPADFRFSVKLAKAISHEQKLNCTRDYLRETLEPIQHLEEKLGCLLVQLPPSFQFDLNVEAFFEKLRSCHTGPVAFEPRHLSWASEEARKILKAYAMTQVYADPVLVPSRQGPGSTNDEEFETFVYLRLHGSPVLYDSSYEPERLALFEAKLKIALAKNKNAWCIFDNTKWGHATLNALSLMRSFLKEPRKKSTELVNQGSL